MCSGRHGVRLPNWPMPKLMNNHGNYIGSLGGVTRGSAARPRRSASKFIPVSRRWKCSTAKRRSLGVATGDMGVGRDGGRRIQIHPGHGAARQIYADRRRRARIAGETAHRQIRARRRPRPQKFGIGLKEIWQVDLPDFQKGRVQHSLVGRWGRRERRLVFVPLRRSSGGGRLRRPSRLSESVSFAVRRIPALQDASLIATTFEGGTPGLWRPRDLRGRRAMRAKTRVSRRRADRLLRGFRQPRPHKRSHNAILSGIQAARAAAEAIAVGRSQTNSGATRRGRAAPESAAT